MVQSLCAKLGSLRKLLKEAVVKSQIGNIWIPDVLEGLYGSKEAEGRDPAEGGGGLQGGCLAKTMFI